MMIYDFGLCVAIVSIMSIIDRVCLICEFQKWMIVAGGGDTQDPSPMTLR